MDAKNRLLLCSCLVYLIILLQNSVFGTGRFIKQPETPLKVKQGERATFSWDYVLDGTTTLDFGKWGRVDASGNFESILIMKQTSGQANPTVVSANSQYKFRTQSFPLAGMVISGINQTDEGLYRCSLSLTVGELSSTVKLVVLVIPVIDSRSQPSVVIEEGQNATLLCGASVGNPRPFTFFWKHDSIVLTSTSNDAVFNLDITNASRQSRGQYECNASNEAGSDLYVVTVTVRFKPVITTSPDNKEVQEGGNTNMFCLADAFPDDAVYSWHRDPAFITPITDNGNYQITEGGKRLSFDNVQESMTGDYYCIATNIKGRSQPAKAKLDVIFKPRNINITASNGVVQVLEHINTTVKCRVDANPPAFYTWSKDGLVVSSSASGDLILSNPSKVDSGLYICSATNKLGSLTATIQVDVRYAPKDTRLSVNSTTNQYVGIKGRPINMSCTADSNPQATYSIKLAGLPGGELSTGPGYYYIANADEVHEDTYDCFASNSILPVGTSSLDVILAVLPEISHLHLNPSASRVVENQTIALECNVIARPIPDIEWRFNGNVIASNDSVRVITTNANGSRGKETIVLSKILFSGIRNSDEGTYECSSINFAGSVKRSFVIDVKYLPKVVSGKGPQNVTINASQTLSLSCQAEGDPIVDNYQWKHNGDIITGQTTDVLTVTNTIPATAGTYSCAGISALGIGVESNGYITVQYAPQIVNPPQDQLVNSSATVSFLCNATGVPQPIVKWYKSENEVSIGTTLTFDSVSYKDKGFYLCVAHNDLGTFNASVNLQVQHSPVITTTTPSFVKHGVVIGDDVSFVCSVDALPVATLSWKLGVNVVVSDAIKYVIDTSQSTSTLKVLEITRADFASYVCEATSTYGFISQDYEITDKGLPDPPVTNSLHASDTLQLTVPPSVAVQFTWINGFNGGYEINLYILYREVGISRYEEVSIGNPSGSTYVLTKLKTATEYEFSMRATNQEGVSEDYSPLIRYKTKDTPPSRGTADVDKSAVVSNGIITVSWIANDISMVKEIQVRYKKIADSAWVTETVAPSKSSVDISNIDADASYEVQVIFVHNDGSLGIPTPAGLVLPGPSVGTSSGLKEEEIIAIVVGCGGFILVVIVIIALLCVRRKKKASFHKSTPIELTHGSASRSFTGYTPGGADVVRTNFVVDNSSYSTNPVHKEKEKDSPPPSYKHHILPDENQFYNDGFNDTLTTSFKSPNNVGNTPAYGSFSKDTERARRGRAAEIEHQRLDDDEDDLNNRNPPHTLAAAFVNETYTPDNVDSGREKGQPIPTPNKLTLGNGAFYNPQSATEDPSDDDVDDLDLPVTYHGAQLKPTNGGMSTDDEYSGVPRPKQRTAPRPKPRENRVPGSLSSTAAGRGNKKNNKHSLGRPISPPVAPDMKHENGGQSSPASTHSGVSSRPYVSDNEYVEPEDANYVGYLV